MISGMLYSPCLLKVCMPFGLSRLAGGVRDSSEKDPDNTLFYIASSHNSQQLSTRWKIIGSVRVKFSTTRRFAVKTAESHLFLHPQNLICRIEMSHLYWDILPWSSSTPPTQTKNKLLNKMQSIFRSHVIFSTRKRMIYFSLEARRMPLIT